MWSPLPDERVELGSKPHRVDDDRVLAVQVEHTDLQRRAVALISSCPGADVADALALAELALVTDGTARCPAIACRRIRVSVEFAYGSVYRRPLTFRLSTIPVMRVEC
jgi:hypothetical protein